VLRHLASDPQVDAAGFVSRLPLSPSNTVGDLALPGQEDAAFPCDLRLASPGYFEAQGIPLRSVAGAARVARWRLSRRDLRPSFRSDEVA